MSEAGPGRQWYVALTDVELDELSQFLFWIEDRTLAGPPWWEGEEGPISFRHGRSEALDDAVGKVHHAWRQLKGVSHHD